MDNFSIKKSLYVKRSTFLTEQGFIQAFLALFCFIGIPGIIMLAIANANNNYNIFFEIIGDIFSSIETSILFIIMVSVPIIAFLIVIFANIYDYYCFKKNPKGIKAISLCDGYICLHCNKTIYDKILYLNEINKVMFRYKQTDVVNPISVSKGFKLGGAGLAMGMARITASKYIYEVEISIIDKNNEEYVIIISAKFSNKPYTEMDKVKDFFKKSHVNVTSNRV